jgi:CHAT domain-containing protein
MGVPVGGAENSPFGVRVPRALLRCAAPAALAGGCLLTAVPANAALYHQVCGGDAATPVSLGTDESLRELVRNGDAMLASERASRGDDALRLLGVASLQDGGPANAPQLVAEYCLTAGQAMRIAREGSGREAKMLLVGAFRRAGAIKDGDIAARAALQIGLTAVAESAGGAARGVRGAKDDLEAATSAAMQACAPAIGDVMNAGADYFTAAAALDCAGATALATGDARIAAIANLRLARLSLDYAQRDPVVGQILRQDAEERLVIAIDQAMRIPALGLRAEVALRAIETLLTVKPQAPRVASALDSLAPTTAADPALEAYRLALAARLAGANGRTAEQKQLLSRAIFLEGQRSQPARLATWYLDLAQADPARRGEYIAASYRALEAVRPLLPQYDPVTQESTFQLSVRAVFEKAAEYELAGDLKDRGSIDRAQTIIERYRQAELQSVFGSECVAARDPLRPADLAPGEMLLYPVLLPDHVELIYATSGSNGFQRLRSDRGVGRAEVTALVEEMVAATSAGSDTWRASAARLYGILVDPVLRDAPDAKTIIVVPDGPLRSVPFAALTDASGKFLVERARVVTAPALGYAEPGKPFARSEPAVLALALSKEVDLPAGIFPKLEGTIDEAKAAAGMRGVLVQDFRKADLEQALEGRRIDILHISTHASFNGRADRAFIVGNGEAIRLSELRDLVSDNQVRGEELGLLVLGACETAVGDDQASMGLAGAAVQAGAQSAVASLWQVNDLGTVRLMRAFYDNLRAGQSKAQALQTAQLSLINAGPDFANPNIWSAFILLGGWR